MRGQVSDKLKPLLEQVNQAVAEMKAQNIPFDVATTRTNLDNLAAFMNDSPEIELVVERQFTNGEQIIPARVYHPQPSKPLPVLLHFHGGGHMCGSIELYDPVSRQLAKYCNMIVIAIDYRLAPEHPYPAGIEDSMFALKHYQQVLEGLLYQPKVSIIGDSAGGAICTTLAHRCQSAAEVTIDKQVLIYPSVDYTMSQPSIEENGDGFLLQKEKIAWYFQQYFNGEADTQLLRAASPLLQSFSKQLPATLVITAGCDPLRDEGEAYYQMLRRAGVEAQHHQLPDMIHAYMLLHELVANECHETYVKIAEFLNVQSSS
ncbi:alpha/beta hydrolase [Thalassotalea maritima]|uniref:alpha/beta hydrolase n=1 Tax=Thalassotalea maritima TaxID=3242416 RepID=UPI0035292C93